MTLKKPWVLIFFFILASCGKPLDLKHLNGYWEIEKVKMPDGHEKKYTLNTSIDFIELVTDSSGVRKKMQPQLDGTFITSDDYENFSIYQKNGKTILKYQTEMASWEEELISLKENSFSVLNDAGLTYFYKRFKPFNLTE